MCKQRVQGDVGQSIYMDVSLDGQVRQHIYMEGNLYTVLAETPKGPKKKLSF